MTTLSKDTMEINNQLPPIKSKIGIWGFGVVGKSVLSFLTKKDYTLSLLEQRELTPLEVALVTGHNVQCVDQHYLPQFLEMNDFIIASPGIDLEPYKGYAHKWITELDLFAAENNIPVIAITGSVGKTSIVTLLTGLLNALGKRAIALGNIGTPMLDILEQLNFSEDNKLQPPYDYLVMELSSFQLEHTKHFKPTIAAITNLIPNHLDRHKTLENYLFAKSKIIKNQTEEDRAIIPMEFMDIFWPFVGQQKITWVGEGKFDDIALALSDITCMQNWNLIFSILEALNLPIEEVTKYAYNISMPKHRVELVRIFKTIRFYNDSKGTLIESTQQAIGRFKTEPILLFLGGLCKGVDRKPLIESLPSNIKQVFCFGKEADQLAQWCIEAAITCSIHETLESAFETCVKVMKDNDIVLLSPSGSSYDLFKNYEERGKRFAQLVNNLKE